MSKKSKKPAIPFNVFADYSDLVMKSIFKNIADKCHSQAKELAPNGINFEHYEEFKGPPPHTNQRCTMTPMENKMSEIKTETHLGKVYQIDQEYLFSNDGTHLFYGRLKAICPKSSYPFEGHDGKFSKYIGLIQDCKDQGTITPAPVELVDGAAYMFDSKFIRDAVGIYCKKYHRMYFTEGMFAEPEWLENIRLMTVESK
jgi:hypothetical protein